MVPLDQLPAQFDVKVLGSGHDLPSKAHVDWLVCPEPCSEVSSSENEKDDVRCCYVGVGVSVRGRSVPDAIVLSYAKRLLVIRFKSIYTKKRANHEMMSHVARFLADLSRHTLSSAVSSCDSRQQQQQEYRVVLVCFQGAILALLLYQTLKLRFSVVDLSSRSSTRASESSDFQLIQAHLGSDAVAKLGRLPYERFLVIDAALNLKQPLRGFLATMRLTISAHLVALHYSRWSSTGVELEPFAASQTNYESTIVSTRCVAQQVVDHLSTCAQVHSALHLMAGKTQTANLAMDANGSSVEYTHQEGRSSICVTNTDFRTKLGASSRQGLKISTLDGAVLRAKTTRSEGRTSTLDIHGVTAGLANLKIASVEVMGRPDRASEYSCMVRHWTDLLRVVEIGQDSQTGEMVPVEMANSLSGLCGALLFNHRVPHFQPKHSPSSILCSSPSSLTAIASDTLNESQRLAAEAVFAPLPSRDWRQCPHDPRILLVHGPPGTGKTKVIATVCKQFAVLAGGARTDEAIYAACQSNTAVKNIGEALERAGVDFKILVSPNFYVDWHEDLYTAIKARLLVTDRLMASPQAFREQLGSSMVILMTISGLSAARYTNSVPLFEAKRMRMLLVDEASQIHLSAYPHILRRFENTLSRVVFFGDDEQLAPFGSDDVAQADQSVFELEHLREHAHLLDTSYRLPRGLCEFISEAVYGGELHAAQTVSDRTLSECVAFVDVDRGRHVKGRTTPSLVNTHEAETVVRLVRYLRGKGVGFKVLTAYDAQRNEIETRLKKQGLSGSGDVVFNIDAFQGQETDVIVASLVRDGIIATTQTTENQARATVGFLKNQRRTNVLLTRCKRLVIVVSSKRFVTGAACGTLIGRLESQASEQDGDIWTSESDVMNGRFERLDELLSID